VRNYETMYVLRPDLEQERMAELVTRFQGVVSEQGGELTELKEMGRRRLAYEIDGVREGFYVLMHFAAENDVTSELERVFRITDGVLRYLTVREGE